MLARLGVVKNILKGRLYSKRAYVLPANPDCTVYTSTFCVALWARNLLWPMSSAWVSETEKAVSADAATKGL